MLTRQIYRHFVNDDRRRRLMNEWAIVGVIALTFGPLLVVNMVAALR